ncbi:E3 ubiquitin-protein ligase [Acrasis kona]|uniref:E3 ubiquitin-protein ligase n=1 Tax=Acrasis kona TaxID=1008807 RepID=A0AAW2Z0M4_9EUKA
MQSNSSKSVETEDFKRDIIAGSALSDCRNLAIAYMKARGSSNTMLYQRSESSFLDCVNDYAKMKAGAWSSARNGDNVYYFDRQNGTIQWNRPDQIDEDIQKGKLKYGQRGVEKCEFLHLQLVLCEKTVIGQTKGCNQEYRRFLECFKKYSKEPMASEN